MVMLLQKMEGLELVFVVLSFFLMLFFFLMFMVMVVLEMVLVLKMMKIVSKMKVVATSIVSTIIIVVVRCNVSETVVLVFLVAYHLQKPEAVMLVKVALGLCIVVTVFLLFGPVILAHQMLLDCRKMGVMKLVLMMVMDVVVLVLSLDLLLVARDL